MEKNSTKNKILQAALDLFSVNGYEATSISQIAQAVGVRKASLYSHFASKQDILDTLIQVISTQFQQHSIFAGADWDDPAFTRDKSKLGPEEMTAMIRGQIRFILHDPHVSKARKLMVIEQFQNPTLSRLHTKHSYTDVMCYNLGMIKFLIRQGVLRDEDPEIMAAQLCFPVSMWTNLCDREPEREEEIMSLIERHVAQFYRAYGT